MKIELPDELVPEVVVELRRIRDKAGELNMGHGGRYSMVKSVAEANRQAENRQQEWDQSPLGKLFKALQDAAIRDLSSVEGNP